MNNSIFIFIFQKLLAADDAADKVILNEIDVLVSTLYLKTIYFIYKHNLQLFRKSYPVIQT